MPVKQGEFSKFVLIFAFTVSLAFQSSICEGSSASLQILSVAGTNSAVAVEPQRNAATKPVEMSRWLVTSLGADVRINRTLPQVLEIVEARNPELAKALGGLASNRPPAALAGTLAAWIAVSVSAAELQQIADFASTERGKKLMALYRAEIAPASPVPRLDSQDFAAGAEFDRTSAGEQLKNVRNQFKQSSQVLAERYLSELLTEEYAMVHQTMLRCDAALTAQLREVFQARAELAFLEDLLPHKLHAGKTGAEAARQAGALRTLISQKIPLNSASFSKCLAEFKAPGKNKVLDAAVLETYMLDSLLMHSAVTRYLGALSDLAGVTLATLRFADANRGSLAISNGQLRTGNAAADAQYAQLQTRIKWAILREQSLLNVIRESERYYSELDTLLFSPQLVNIGVAVPLSTGYPMIGMDIMNAVEYALNVSNEKSIRVNGRRVHLQLQVGDEGLGTEKAKSVAKALVQSKVAAVVGHLSGPATLSAAEVYAGAGVPVITPSAAADAVTASAQAPVLRGIASETQFWTSVAHFVAGEVMAKSVVMVGVEDNTPAAMESVMEATLRGKGIRTQRLQALASDDKSIDQLASSIVATAPDVVIFSVDPDIWSRLVRKLRSLGSKAQFVLQEWACDASSVAKAGPVMEGSFCSNITLLPEQLPGGSGFVKNYQQRVGPMLDYAPYAYDATMAIVSAMQGAGSTQPADILAYMKRTSFEGVTGGLQFGADGARATGAISILKVKGGSLVPHRAVSIKN